MKARRKLSKITADIEQLEKTIAENQKRLAELKEEKTEAENNEIVSLVRNANLSVDDIAALISDFSTVKKTPVSNTSAIPTNNTLKGNGD